MTVGKILWTDLTVPNAGQIRDFYSAVTGWSVREFDGDYNMVAADDTDTAGVCHAVGQNANLPPQWLIYIAVADLDASIAACQQHGGSVIDGPRSSSESRFCVIRDPAGAVAALIETKGA